MWGNPRVKIGQGLKNKKEANGEINRQLIKTLLADNMLLSKLPMFSYYMDIKLRKIILMQVNFDNKVYTGSGDMSNSFKYNDKYK